MAAPRLTGGSAAPGTQAQSMVSLFKLYESRLATGRSNAASWAKDMPWDIRASLTYHVPLADIMAIQEQESGGRQHTSGGQTLTSSTGALGVMQLEPATARGLGVNPYVRGPNIMGGTRYLGQLLQAAHGDAPTAFAGYYAGPGGMYGRAGQAYGGAVWSRVQRLTGGSAALQKFVLFPQAAAPASQYNSWQRALLTLNHAEQSNFLGFPTPVAWFFMILIIGMALAGISIGIGALVYGMGGADAAMAVAQVM